MYSVNQSLPHSYQRSTWSTLTLWSSFREGWNLGIFFVFWQWQGSHFRMMFFYPFAFSPIFLLAQILMRTDLGDEPDSLRRLRSNPTGGGHRKDAANLTALRARSLPPAEPTKEIRTADTATMCHTLKSLREPESNPRDLSRSGGDNDNHSVSRAQGDVFSIHI